MKKKYLLLTLVLCAISATSFGQNLVPNPSFEIQDTCPQVSEIQLAPPWTTPSLATPDLYNSTCTSQNPSARTGVGSSGVFCYSTFSNYREYIQAPLTTTLQSGTGYCVSFWVKRTNYRYSTNQFGAYFSGAPMSANSTSVLTVTPQVTNDPNNMLSGTNWIQVSGSFVANGTESYIIIGSFANDAQTDTLVTNSASTNYLSYYRIDDVSVVECNVGMEEANWESQIALYPSPSSSNVTIRNGTNSPVSNCQVLDLSGKIVLEVDTHILSDDLTFNVDMIQNGSYLVKMTLDGKVVTKRLQVVH